MLQVKSQDRLKQANDTYSQFLLLIDEAKIGQGIKKGGGEGKVIEAHFEFSGGLVAVGDLKLTLLEPIDRVSSSG